MNEHPYDPVDFGLWNVLKPHVKSEKLKKVVLLHIFGGGKNAIFVTSEDKVYATGTDLRSFVGVGYETCSNALVELSGLSHKNIKCFSSGFDFTMALTKDGQLLSCGKNEYGQLGIGTFEQKIGTCSVMIPKEEIIRDWKLHEVTIVSIQCGFYYSLALTSSNKVYEWGCRNPNEIQSVQSVKIGTPKLMLFNSTMGTICRISCCGYFYSALTENGDLYKWEERSGEIIFVAGEVLAMGCSSDGLIYIRHGDLYKNNVIISAADDFVVQDNYLCYKKEQEFFLKKDSELAIKVEVSNFQSAFENHSCPQFMRISYTKDIIIHDRNIYKTLYNNKDLSDLTIKLSNGSIYLHKAILISFCEHFRQILTGPWAASNSTEMGMTSYNAVAYETLLKYVYSGIFYGEKLTGSDLIDLYNIADSYFETDLRENVLEAFKHCLTVDNVCRFYALADKQMQLVEECLSFASGNPLNIIVTTEGYRKMKSEVAQKFVVDCATRNLQY